MASRSALALDDEAPRAAAVRGGAQEIEHRQAQWQEPEQQQQQQQGAAGAAAELPPLPPLPPGAGQEAARIVRHACDLLALPTRVACSALMFLHRAESEELPPERLAAACVFLAAKVEEASVRTNDMLNAVAAWRLAAACGSSGSGGGNSSRSGEDKGQGNGGAGGDSNSRGAGTAGEAEAAHRGAAGGAALPAASVGGGWEERSAASGEAAAAAAAAAAVEARVAAAAAAFPCLVGEAYAAAKRQLILDEQLLLRRLRFDIGVEQPHRHLYVLAHCWGAGAPVVRAATCLLNDGISHCPSFGRPGLPPATAAAAALHVGAQLAGQEVRPHGWWRATGISDAELSAACSTLLDLLQAP